MFCVDNQEMFLRLVTIYYFVGKESAASLLDREERLRLVKEKHNEDRQKKLDELKQQV